MTKKYSTKGAFSSDSIYFILITYWMYILVIGVACLTYLTFMHLMTLVYYANRLISLSSHVFIQNKWPVCMYFKSLSICVLFRLDFWIYLKIIFFLGLFLYLHSERRNVIYLCDFHHCNRLIYFCLKSANRFLAWFNNPHFLIIFAWWKSVPKVHLYFCYNFYQKLWIKLLYYFFYKYFWIMKQFIYNSR